MNKTRVAAILGLIVCFFIICELMVPFSLPLFSIESYIIALFFPFITRRYRVIVTSLYQVVHLTSLGVMWNQLTPFIDNVFSSRASTTSAATTISGYSLRILGNYNFTYLLGFAAMMGLLYILLGGLSLLPFIGLCSQPYSVYFIYEKIGLIKRIERACPQANPEWWKT